MLKRLATMGLIEMIPWRGVFLTAEGEEAGAGKPRATSDSRKFLVGVGRQSGNARRDAEGMEHHVSEETLDAFRLFYPETRCQMSLPFLRTLQGDRFFQLLILVGVGLSFFVPFCTEILACCYRLGTPSSP